MIKLVNAEKLIPKDKVTISMEDVTISYRDTDAVRRVFCDIPRKKVTSLIGPSGCGKSTVLRSLNRMNDLIQGCKLSGKVTFEGNDLYQQNAYFEMNENYRDDFVNL